MHRCNSRLARAGCCDDFSAAVMAASGKFVSKWQRPFPLQIHTLPTLRTYYVHTTYILRTTYYVLRITCHCCNSCCPSCKRVDGVSTTLAGAICIHIALYILNEEHILKNVLYCTLGHRARTSIRERRKLRAAACFVVVVRMRLICERLRIALVRMRSMRLRSAGALLARVA